MKENLLHDARQFLESAEWYAERGMWIVRLGTTSLANRLIGIPYRRGYLLVCFYRLSLWRT